MARPGRGKGAPPLLPHLREGVVVTRGHSAASLLARGPGRCPIPTPRNMSVAILLRLLSLSSMRESWSGVCGERNWVRAGGKEGRRGKERKGEGRKGEGKGPILTTEGPTPQKSAGGPLRR